MKKRRPAQAKALKSGAKISFENSTPSTGIVKTGDDDLEISQEQIDAAFILTHVFLGLNASIDPYITCSLLAEGLAQGLSVEEATALGETIAKTAVMPLSDPNACAH